MARKGKRYRRGYRAAKRRYKKGFGFPKLIDLSQVVYNVEGLGYVDAAELAMGGKFKEAASYLGTRAYDPNVMFRLGFGNLLIGITRKVVRSTGGKWVRKVIA